MGTKAMTKDPTKATGMNVDGTDYQGKDTWLSLQHGADQNAWQQTTNANRPDTEGLFGGQRWEIDPATGQSTLNSEFSGPLVNAGLDIQRQWADMLRTPMADGSAARDQAIEASYGQATKRLDPMWDKREAASRTQLLNQGLDPTSEAGKSAMSELGMQRNDAYSSAMNSAIQQGTAAGDSVFRNNLAARNNPLQQMQGMQGLLETPRFNMAGNAPVMQFLQALGLANNASLGEASHNNALVGDGVQGGATALAAMAAMMSDLRTKKRIHRYDAEALPGVPWASWEYKHEPGVRRFGVIAQDLEKVAPQYVITRSDGVKFVDLSFLSEVKHG